MAATVTSRAVAVADPGPLKPGNNTVGAKDFDLTSMQPDAVHRNVTIGYSDDIVGFAPFYRTHKCQSRAGRWRSRHSFDADGVCCWCDQLARGDMWRPKGRRSGTLSHVEPNPGCSPVGQPPYCTEDVASLELNQSYDRDQGMVGLDAGISGIDHSAIRAK